MYLFNRSRVFLYSQFRANLNRANLNGNCAPKNGASFPYLDAFIRLMIVVCPSRTDLWPTPFGSGLAR